jgi:hypothetical protein
MDTSPSFFADQSVQRQSMSSRSVGSMEKSFWRIASSKSWA